SPVISYDKT
nr:RecName: Full=Unknown protein 10 from 2D-page [Bombyx mori]